MALASFQRVPNFRDVAASTADSANCPLLKPGLFFRSAAPDDATPSDRVRLCVDYKLKTIIDLRSHTEHYEVARKNAAKVPPASDPAMPDLHTRGHADSQGPLRLSEVDYKLINFNGSNYSRALIWQLSYFNIAKLFTWYTLGYRTDAISILGENVMAKRGLIGLAEDSLMYCGAEVKAVFDVLSKEESYPVLVHCTQGKDRTGLVVLLVLMLLELEVVAITHDYMLSNEGLATDKQERIKLIEEIGLPAEFASCSNGWVGEISRWIDVNHGGIREYLHSCGVSSQQMDTIRRILRY